MPLEILSPSDQVASHLRKQLIEGRWKREFPGTPALSKELSVDRKTIISAISQLEDEGLLKSQGPGKPRRVIPPKRPVRNQLNIRFLPYEDDDRQRPHILGVVPRVQESGHLIVVDNKSLTDLGMNVERVARHVEAHPADAWIVQSGSLEILKWFSEQEIPSMAVYGRRRNIPISSIGPDKVAALNDCVQRLVELGHRRIVLMARHERRHPTLGFIEQQFLNALEKHGIESGPYHLPEWDDNPGSFHLCLDRLFEHTPPTALILDEAQFYVAAQQHLAQWGLSAPKDISMVSCDIHPIFEWCYPSVAHIQWDTQPIIDYVAHWISQLARGRNDRKPSFSIAEFHPEGTIGPVAS